MTTSFRMLASSRRPSPPRRGAGRAAARACLPAILSTLIAAAIVAAASAQTAQHATAPTTTLAAQAAQATHATRWMQAPRTAQAGQTVAGGLQQEVAAMRQELATLRAEVDVLKQALATSAGAPAGTSAAATPSTAASAAAQAALAEAADAVPVLQTQVQELAQVKVESSSRLPVKLFGTILSNTFFNSDEANWLENPNIVNRFAGPTGRPGSFSSTLRQSRIGVSIDGPAVGGMRATGRLVMDFFGGTPAFQTGQVMGLPRMLYAFGRLDGARTAIEIGQDQMMLAPRDPTSLAASSFPDLFRAGNLYLRVPQARLEQKLGAGLTVMGGIIAPIAGDFNDDFYTFVPPARAGERSKMPAYQGHLGYRSRSDDETREVAVGVSGHYGRERNGDTTTKSWASALDFNLQGGRIGVAGEFFTGENIDQFGGSLGQPAKSTGGWTEARFTMTSRLSVNGGAGFDTLPDGEFLSVPRRENRSLFGNVILELTPELAASIEYRWLSTRYGEGTRRENHHVNWVFAYSF